MKHFCGGGIRWFSKLTRYLILNLRHVAFPQHNSFWRVITTYRASLWLFVFDKIHSGRDERGGVGTGEMNVGRNLISAILVQMSARLSFLFSSCDKETELSNCFLLLLPWRWEGIREANRGQAITLGSRRYRCALCVVKLSIPKRMCGF